MVSAAVALAEVAARYRVRRVALVAVKDAELHRAAVAALSPEVQLLDAEAATGAADLEVDLVVTSVAERLADLPGRVFLLAARGEAEQRGASGWARRCASSGRTWCCTSRPVPPRC